MTPIRASVLFLLFVVAHSGTADSACAQGTTTRASVDSSGAEGKRDSLEPALSADGRFVAFTSSAANLVASDNNHAPDVFVHDLVTGVTERVSVDSSGGEGDRASLRPALSADGQVVAFMSSATNLVPGDTNRRDDIFVHDRVSGITERVSVDSSGGEADADCFTPALSGDGRWVTFFSGATNLVAQDSNARLDVFVHDRSTGITERVSVDSAGGQGDGNSSGGVLSGDGRFVAFTSAATNLVPGDLNLFDDIFLRDRSTGVVERVSVAVGGGDADASSGAASISADGRFVAFHSAADDLIPVDLNFAADVFVRDRTLGTTDRVSVDSSGAEADGGCVEPSIAADGSAVAFLSGATNLVAADLNGLSDAFVHDRITGRTERVSIDSSGAEADGVSWSARLAGNGQVAAFSSPATNLVSGDGNGALDAFVHVRCDFAASATSYGAGFPGTQGVPSFAARSAPTIGTQLTIDLGNSSGTFTFGLLLAGSERAALPSVWGGDLLVIPTLVVPIGLGPLGATWFADIPFDDRLCGIVVDLQALEGDPGALHGVSFTAGVELLFGR